MPKKTEILKQKFIKSVSLPFQQLLPESTIIEILKAEKIEYRDRLFNPIVTLWAFLSQVLDSDKSCSNTVTDLSRKIAEPSYDSRLSSTVNRGASKVPLFFKRDLVSRIVTWLIGEGVQPPSTDTSGYCKARMRLSEKLLQRLLHLTGLGLEVKASGSKLWCGHHVKVLDGSSVSMPDTAPNQKAYPQVSNQAPECGFPIAKILVIFSLATGAAMDVLIDVFNTSDVTMARKMYSLLNTGDVALADCAFGTYVDLVFVQSQKAEAIERQLNRDLPSFW